jgi:hypothetical protein
MRLGRAPRPGLLPVGAARGGGRARFRRPCGTLGLLAPCVARGAAVLDPVLVEPRDLSLAQQEAVKRNEESHARVMATTPRGRDASARQISSLRVTVRTFHEWRL